MARKINDKLIKRLTKGDLVPLLNYLKAEERNLRLEVRRGGKAYIYYKKCKILELGLECYNIDDKYFENNHKLDDIKERVINNPPQYFKDTITVVDKWLSKHPKLEFVSQQNIAHENQGVNDRYIILDMEYNFSQSEITKSDRIKKAGFDLLGIERQTGKIVFFEVKKGLKALSGKAGISSHIMDFEECLFGKNKDIFRNNLISDIKNIVNDKKLLGLIENFDLPDSLSLVGIELIFVFEPLKDEITNYSKKYIEEYLKSGSKKTYQTIFVTKNDFILK